MTSAAGEDRGPRGTPGEERREEPPGRVACTVCGKEVPRSEARSAEGTDYVWYFCGPDCFAHWHPGFPKPPLDP